MFYTSLAMWWDQMLTKVLRRKRFERRLQSSVSDGPSMHQMVSFRSFPLHHWTTDASLHRMIYSHVHSDSYCTWCLINMFQENIISYSSSLSVSSLFVCLVPNSDIKRCHFMSPKSSLDMHTFLYALHTSTQVAIT